MNYYEIISFTLVRTLQQSVENVSHFKHSFYKHTPLTTAQHVISRAVTLSAVVLTGTAAPPCGRILQVHLIHRSSNHQ